MDYQEIIRHLHHDRRLVPADGMLNMRDLGGFPAGEGSTVRWGLLYRSDSLCKLTSAGEQLLRERGVRTVIDLRTRKELADNPNPLRKRDGIAYHNIELMAPNSPLPSWCDVCLPDESRAYPAYCIIKLYWDWLENRKDQFAAVLGLLGDAHALPAVFHCAGGKDRTGVTTALILGLAGVPAETIADDYGLTARYLSPMYLAEAARHPTIETEDDYRRAFCPPAAMSRVLAHLDRVYGDVEGYVRAAGLTEAEIDRLRHAIAGPEAQG